MAEQRTVLVVGGGPAGVSAAVALAEGGARVLLVEQRDRLGGAIHRQPASAATPHAFRLARHERSWRRLTARLDAVRDRIVVANSTIFLGFDGDGLVLLDHRNRGQVVALKPDGVLLALGAREFVAPFPGWELPGVMTVGGAQVLLKETGRPLPGPTLIAGTGPLLPALAAQLCRAGAPPIAVLERGSPFRRLRDGLSLLAHPAQLGEAAGYLARVTAAGVPYLSRSRVVKAARTADGGLVVTVDRAGRPATYNVRNLFIHDGLRTQSLAGAAEIPVVEAGDGREILGADGALADGQRAAFELLMRLGLPGSAVPPGGVIQRARELQRRLSRIFAAPIAAPPPETVLCRCENRRVADLPQGYTQREAKLVARVGMGDCQGRFCREATELALGVRATASAFRPDPMRWPLRPVTAAALANLHYAPSDFGELWINEHPAA